jgi:hypothetical protein
MVSDTSDQDLEQEIIPPGHEVLRRQYGIGAAVKWLKPLW